MQISGEVLCAHGSDLAAHGGFLGRMRRKAVVRHEAVELRCALVGENVCVREKVTGGGNLRDNDQGEETDLD